MIITVGEMFADALDSALHGAEMLNATESYDAWADYARHMLTNSPTLAELIGTRLLDAHQLWWPSIRRL
jgi:hypothetical protein